MKHQYYLLCALLAWNEYTISSTTTGSAVQRTINVSLLHVPVSTGELFDKITILEIKIRRLTNETKRQNALSELQKLTTALDAYLAITPELEQLKEKLTHINEQLWDIEDSIRAKEADQQFDEEFVELARSVYFTNDQRSTIKRKINKLTGSDLIEEKQYTKY